MDAEPDPCVPSCRPMSVSLRNGASAAGPGWPKRRIAALAGVVAMALLAAAAPADPPRSATTAAGVRPEPVRDPTADADPYRPAYHFTPRAHWMNDPNGLVYLDGVYHLFFQHNPDATVWGPMHWGHATSTDLVHWQEQPIALFPDARGTIFSGSVVVDADNTSGLGQGGRPPLLALFTYHQEAAKQAGQLPQSQGLAFSLDGGASWTKYAGNPVLQPGIGQPDFRDPKVFWHQPSHSWIMTLAVGDHAEFFGSPDLKAWHQLGRFEWRSDDHGGVWECPDLVEMPVAGTGQTKWVLFQSINPGGPNGGSATRYFVGDFDGRTFTVDPGFERMLRRSGPRWLDWGRDNYASVTWSGLPAAQRRVVMIGWMTNWDYALTTPSQTWRGAMTLPREIALHRAADGTYAIHALPAQEIRRLAGAPTVLAPRRLSGTIALPLGTIDVSQARVDLAFAPGTARTVGLELTNAAGDVYRFGYDRVRRTFTSDRRNAGLVGFSPHFASLDTAPRTAGSAVVRMSLYIDRSSVEAFLDNGATVMTTALFPRQPYATLRIFAAGGEAGLLDARVAPMAGS